MVNPLSSMTASVPCDNASLSHGTLAQHDCPLHKVCTGKKLSNGIAKAKNRSKAANKSNIYICHTIVGIKRLQCKKENSALILMQYLNIQYCYFAVYFDS